MAPSRWCPSSPEGPYLPVAGRRRFLAVLAGAVVVGGSVGCSRDEGPAPGRTALRSEAWSDLEAGERSAAPPLTGLVPYAPEPGDDPGWAATAPSCSMEYVEIAVSRVVTGPGTYDWAVLEAHLDDVAARGHRSVVRFWLDMPGEPTGVPQFLLDRGMDTSRRYPDWDNNNVSFSPDYTDASLREMLLGLVAAFGEGYDGDERLGIVQHGLLGFWAEGHTYPYNGEVSQENPSGLDWSPPSELVDTLATAWGTALPTTWHEARYPSAVALQAGAGFHDDSLGLETVGPDSWTFLSQMTAAGALEAWRTVPMGGEVWPDLAGCALSDPTGCQGLELAEEDNPILAAATRMSISWLLADDWFTQEAVADAGRRLAELDARLGAVIRPTRVRLEESFATGPGRTTSSPGTEEIPTTSRAALPGAVVVEMANDGTAPPYWRGWPCQARVVEHGTAIAAGVLEDIDWISLVPGATLRLRVPLTAVEPEAAATPGQGGCQGLLQVRVPDPLTGQGVPLADAGWQADDAGWSTLGVIGR